MQTLLLCLTLTACIIAAFACPENCQLKASPVTKTNIEISTKPEESVADKVKESATLKEIARQTLLNHFENQSTARSLSELCQRFLIPDNYKRARGVFVTLSKNGKTRACWGSIEPHHPDLVSATIYATEDALNKEYRYPRITKSELGELRPQVTVIESITALGNLEKQNPLADGLMVRNGGRGAVILPGEAVAPHHQLVLAKLKAGIPSSTPCQLYKLESDVYK